MNAATPRVGERRPGGRSARIRSAVLAAAHEALAESGYDELSFEDVAARAGVHKTTVYRRWPTKADLVADAMKERSQRYVPVPDTGSFAADLRALARSVVANLGSPVGREVTRTLVAASSTSALVAESTHAFWAARLALTTVIVERAIERGEVPAATDPDLIIETLIGPLYVRLLLTGEPINRSVADRVAALVAAGASHSRRR